MLCTAFDKFVFRGIASEIYGLLVEANQEYYRKLQRCKYRTVPPYAPAGIGEPALF